MSLQCFKELNDTHVISLGYRVQPTEHHCIIIKSSTTWTSLHWILELICLGSITLDLGAQRPERHCFGINELNNLIFIAMDLEFKFNDLNIVSLDVRVQPTDHHRIIIKSSPI